MEINYKRNRGLSYLILSEDSQMAVPHYQKAIFLENPIPGLLSCTVQRLNGEESFCYDITGCQSMKNLFENEKFSQKDLEELLQSWLNIWEILGEYLLDTDFLLLDPSFLYRENRSGSYLFVWFPFQINKKGNSFQTLAEYFLPKLNHKDKAAVALGYGVYKEAVNENINPSALRNLLFHTDSPEKSYTRENETCEEAFPPEAFPESEACEEERQKILDEFYSGDDDEPASYGVWAGTAGLFLICVLVFLLWHFRLFSLFQAFLLAGVLFLMVSGILLYLFVRKRKKDTPVSSQDSSHIPEASSSRLFFPEKSSVVPEESPSDTLTILLQDPPASSPMLTGLGKNKGKSFALKKEQTLIGKWAASADICLDIPTVSRIHARIQLEEGEYFAVDLNSRNGTLINGHFLNPEEKVPLKNNDIISFAQEEFLFTLPSSSYTEKAFEN